ncbi:hypothetical protein [Hyphomonas sp.]|uniref:hypothetical protein n=1 Tax=Hyphomonas sp. TaxID=87 RepID=UPI0025BFFB0D|nr:hypothetical protein [Hyphomonas sp.]MBI1400583.1 hypothetical protein [Hyphomonas sp.]
MPYWYGVTKWGRVYLRHLPTDFAASFAAPGALRPAALTLQLFASSPRLAAAFAPEPRAVPQPVPCAAKPSVHTLSAPAHADTSWAKLRTPDKPPDRTGPGPLRPAVLAA